MICTPKLLYVHLDTEIKDQVLALYYIKIDLKVLW